MREGTMTPEEIACNKVLQDISEMQRRNYEDVAPERGWLDRTNAMWRMLHDLTVCVVKRRDHWPVEQKIKEAHTANNKLRQGY